MRILVYGTLKTGFGNNRLLQNSKLVERGTFEIPNHRLIKSGLPYLIKSKETAPFYGEIYELDSPTTLALLDNLEGHPDWYKRTYIASLDASVYVLQNHKYDELYPFTNNFKYESIFSYGA